MNVKDVLGGIRRSLKRLRRGMGRRRWERPVYLALTEMSEALLDPGNSIEDIANIVLDCARGLTGSEHGYVGSIDPETKDLVAHTFTRMMGRQCQVSGEDARITFPPGPDGRYPTLWGHALNTRQEFYTNSPHTHEMSTGIPAGHISLKNFLTVPAVVGGELVGQVAVANCEGGYSDHDLDAVRRLTELYALAIQRKRAEEEIAKLAKFPSENPNPVLRIAGDGSVLYSNKAAMVLLKAWGCEPDGRLSEHWLEPVLDALCSGQSRRLEVGCDGRVFALTYAPVEGSNYVNVYALEVTERREMEEYQALTRELLGQLNQPGDAVDMLETVTREIRDFLGIDAAGIRLREGDDFPYFVNQGFPGDFVKAENSLCTRGPDGEIVRDEDGKPYLECMCGNILCGRTDPSKPFFTDGGSFWTNSTTKLLAETTDEDRGVHTRNRCNKAGYESLALIPIRADDEVFGLLQLNDKRSGRFTPVRIRYLEQIASSIGMALKRHRAEEALRATRERLQFVLSSTPVIIYARKASGDHAVTFISENVRALLGYDPEEFIDNESFWADHIHVDDRPDDPDWAAHLPERGSVSYEYRFLRKDGKYRWMHNELELVRDGEGNPLEIVGYLTDVTEQKLAEEALRESELRYRALFKSAPLGIHLGKLDGTILAWNDAMCEMFGYKRTELPRVNTAEFYQNGEDRKELIRLLRQNGFVKDFEITLKRKDGQFFDAACNATLLVLGGEDAILTIIEDISERKDAEEEVAKLAKFPSEDPNPVVRISREGTILYGNVASRPLLDTWECEVGGALLGRWCELAMRALETGDDQLTELECGERAFALTYAPVAESHYVNVYAMDITDRKRAEEKIRELNEDLEWRVAERTVNLAEANKALKQRAQQLQALALEFTQTEQRERRRLAQMLHDHLQQLLVGARMRLELLRKRAKSDQMRSAIQEAETLVDESVEASRLLTVELSPPVLHDAGLTVALEWLGRWMQEKHDLSVDVAVDDEAEPAAENIRILLFQCVRELLFNVVKHANVKCAQVRMAYSGDDEVEIVVSDDGIGFDPTGIHQQKGSLTAFGLFSIHERLDLLGGRVAIDSARDRGTRVKLIAPRHVAVSAEGGSTVRPGQPIAYMQRPIRKGRGSAGETDHRIRVLLADDQRVMREGLTALLAQESDIEVVGEAADGEMALELAHITEPDVIIMDVSMPAMDGIEATRRILAELPSVRVIALSMHEEEDMAAKMLQAGAVGYLTKGGPSEALVATIRNASSAIR